MTIELAHVGFADHRAGRALVGEPRSPCADGCGDRWHQQRLSATRQALAPKIDDATHKAIGAAFFWRGHEVTQHGLASLAAPVLTLCLAAHRQSVPPSRPAGKPLGVVGHHVMHRAQHPFELVGRCWRFLHSAPRLMLMNYRRKTA